MIGMISGDKRTSEKKRYSNIKRIVMQCEVEKMETGSDEKCRASFKEAGIDIE